MAGMPARDRLSDIADRRPGCAGIAGAVSIRPRLTGERMNAPAEYLVALDRQAAIRSEFDKAVLAYLGLRPRSGATGLRDGRRAAMVAALDNRATWNQIKDWRRNWRPAPQWAIDLINQKIDARAKELLAGKAA